MSDTVRRTLRATMTNKLATDMTWQGSRTKAAFKDAPMKTVILSTYSCVLIDSFFFFLVQFLILFLTVNNANCMAEQSIMFSMCRHTSTRSYRLNTGWSKAPAA